MNGPEHYREAEKLLAGAHHPDNHPDWAALSVAKAQVHATLALAAASLNQFSLNEGDVEAWSEVTQ